MGNKFETFFRRVLNVSNLLISSVFVSLNAASAEQDWMVRYELVGTTNWSESYEVKIYESGTIWYEGRNKVKVKGTAHRRVDPEQVNALIQEIHQLGFFNLENQYVDQIAENAKSKKTTSGHPRGHISTPIINVTDRQWAVEVRQGNAIKRVLHYGLGPVFGDLGVAQRAMQRIVFRIEQITQIVEWAGHGSVSCYSVNECPKSLESHHK